MTTTQNDNIKTKVQTVLTAVPQTDRDHVVLALEFYSNDVTRTIEAFLRDGAKEALSQWENTSGSKTTSSRKKKKKDLSKKMPAKVLSEDNALVFGERPTNEVCEKIVEMNGVVDRTANDTSLSGKQRAANGNGEYKLHTKKELRVRTLSEASTSSSVDWSGSAKSPYAGLEKSCKDLQKYTIALQHNRVVLNEHIDKAFKRISEVFKELHSLLNEREAELIFQMDKAKNHANDVLASQQSVAVTLKLQTDRAQTMKEHDVAMLRSQIKHFVSERKLLDDLSSAQRFNCDFAQMANDIHHFGAVTLDAYERRRLSTAPMTASMTTSVSQSIGKPTNSGIALAQSEVVSVEPTSRQSATSVPAAIPPTPAAVPVATLASTLHKPSAQSEKSSDSPAVSSTSALNNPRVLTQSASLTHYEQIAVEQRRTELSSVTKHQAQATPSPSQTSEARDVTRSRGRRGTGKPRLQSSIDTGTGTETISTAQEPSSSNTRSDTVNTRGRIRGRGRGPGRGRGQTRPIDTGKSDSKEEPVSPVII